MLRCDTRVIQSIPSKLLKLSANPLQVPGSWGGVILLLFWIPFYPLRPS